LCHGSPSALLFAGIVFCRFFRNLLGDIAQARVESVCRLTFPCEPHCGSSDGHDCRSWIMRPSATARSTASIGDATKHFRQLITRSPVTRTRCPVAMMALRIARPVQIWVARINHPLTVLRKILLLLPVAIVCWRGCVRISTVVVLVPLPTPRLVLMVAVMIRTPRLVLVAAVVILIIRGGSHWKRQAQSSHQRANSR